jgi:hypothetical protein
MGNILENHDVLGVIYDFTNDEHCTLVCKEWYNIILKNSCQCVKCNKLYKIFGTTHWITDDEDPICHGYYGNYTAIEYYKSIKNILKSYPKFIKAINRQSYTLCELAIRYDPTTIQYIKHKTPVLCDMAVNRNYECIKYIELPSEELCLKVVSHNGLLLKYIKNQTSLICYKALKNNINAFQYMNEEFQTDEICEYVLNKNHQLISFIKNIKEQHYLQVFKSHPNYFDLLFPKTHGNAPGVIGDIMGGFMGVATMNNGEQNVAIGQNALNHIIDGSCNVGMGYQAGHNIINGNFNIMIGNEGVHQDDGIIRIGKDQIKNYQAGIYGNHVRGKPVYITEDGELGTYFC